MKIFLGADHAGFQHKELLKDFLIGEGYEVTDFGAQDFNPDDDYPDFVIPVAKAVSADKFSMGIVLGGSGQGEAICANRFPGVRAVVFNGQFKHTDGKENPDEIVLSRAHNNANILSLGARFLNFEEVAIAVEKWLETPFSGDQCHARRLAKIESIRIS